MTFGKIQVLDEWGYKLGVTLLPFDLVISH